MTVRKTLCRIEEIPDNGAIAQDIFAENEAGQRVLDDSLVLLRQNAHVFAYRNVCPHAGRRLDWAPGQFLIEDGYLICAAHGAMFAVASGECVAGPCRGVSLSAAPIEIVDGEVCSV